ncbi:hypothetical protein LINPERHAP1_LOCUS17012, partial [Linum perenne]
NRGSRLHDQVLEDDSRDLSILPSIGHNVGSINHFRLTDTELLQAHRHVLMGSQLVGPFLKEFQTVTTRRLRGKSTTEIEK